MFTILFLQYMQPQFHESGSMFGFLQCMIIHSYGGIYDDNIKAIPMQKPSQDSTDKNSYHAESHEEEIKDIECYVKKDVTKELCFSLHDAPGAQKSKQHYLESIEKFFKECTKSGGNS